MERNKTYLVSAIVFLLLFIVTTIIVLTVNVLPVGLNGTNLGMAMLNMTVFNFFGTNVLWHKATTLLGYFDVALAASYGIVVLCELIKYRSFKKIDRSILLFLLFSLVVLVIYVILGKLPVNFRPLLDDGSLKPSYPSCHTLLSFGIICMIFAQVLKKFRPRRLKILCLLLLGAIMIFGSLGRLFSGDHWLTDIIAGLFLAMMIVSLYCYFAMPYLNEKAKRWIGYKNVSKEQHNPEFQKLHNKPVQATIPENQGKMAVTTHSWPKN
ncbi:MAG: phosphatase PAP2 family protein [Eggerthellaceae bacterium]|nr:phosphatase PAP2 family protein [Eggerthellaceae bacterium]